MNVEILVGEIEGKPDGSIVGSAVGSKVGEETGKGVEKGREIKVGHVVGACEWSADITDGTHEVKTMG